ncbi:unnamed protein product [Phyllotreta striolata]|uniref:Trafficking protein particle complex subunit 11 n=1 Tax=Phyllotreta striolata TaxID=444603 RepID=A0A9N9TXN2_PHYSR|nr:unnamed protein product [Phyllotreta striolata]
MQASTVQSDSDIPQELCVKPLALVGVSGLDVVNNAVHKSIWETFSGNRRIERAPVLFKILGNAQEFPIVKPRRTSYDWYIPKGILKKNWMNKHLYEIPAVIVIFYDLDWNDPQWNEKMMECASRVQSMRAALEGRNTRLTIVLMQNSPPLPQGEDSLAAEKAAALCSSCDIHSQSLFVLPHGDHLQGYAVRLENAFYEYAQVYYQNEAKHIKSHKEHLNKNSHQYLFVRHQFKIAFLSEMRQDNHTAHKHYTNAYNNLLDIRIVDTNALEIRTIAGFINYKLCRLLFVLNLPRDAISQFKSHIERFKARIGFHELTFEHYAWLSKQYSVFGDIFDEAVKLGLPAVQTQHPGIYYQQAAQYCTQRKKLCHELCTTVATYPQPDPLQGANNMEFYGQRPWRPGKLTADPPDPHLESSGIQALQYLEKQVNHSSLIITLYGLAISQYKMYRCPRTRRYLVLQMADEYYDSNDYGKALTLYTHMLTDFRNEQWWDILSRILEKAILCAYLTANVQDYVALALEILGANIKTPLNEKRRIYENLMRILKKLIPFGDPKLSQEILQNAIIHWQPVFTDKRFNLTLDMYNMIASVSVKARFTKKTYEVNQNVILEIFIRSTCPFPLTLTKVSVTLTLQNQNLEYTVPDLDEYSFNFHKDEVKKYVIEFLADCKDINKDIHIHSVNIFMGNLEDCHLNLKYPPFVEVNRNHPELCHFKLNSDVLDFDNVQLITQATVVPRESKLKVEFRHNNPALLGEWYEIEAIVTNEELHDIVDLKIEVWIEEEIANVELSLQPSDKEKKLNLVLNNSQTLQSGEEIATNFFVRSNLVCKCNIQSKLTYVLNGDKRILSIKTEKLPLVVVEPFEVSTKYLSILMDEIDKFYVDEEFGIMSYVKFTSPWPIIIEDTSLDYLFPVIPAEKNQSSQIAGKMFNKDEIAAELRLANCNKANIKSTNVGNYTIKWRREGGHGASTTLNVIGLTCDWLAVGLKLIVPAHGFVRTPMIVEYRFENRSHELIRLDLSMEASESFMFSGRKQFSISLLPVSTRTLQYNLTPLYTGSVVLPRLGLTISESSENGPPVIRQDQLNSLIYRTLPTHVYVMPQLRGEANLPETLKSSENVAVIG